MGDMNVSSQAMIKAAPQVAKAAVKVASSAIEIVKEEVDNIKKVALGGALVGMVAGGPGGALAGGLIGAAAGATILPLEYATKQAIKGLQKLGDFIKKHPEAILAGPMVAPVAGTIAVGTAAAAIAVKKATD